MKTIRIYFEGARRLAPGLAKFLGRTRRIAIIAGKNRSETEKDFDLARRTHADSLVLLLVDADDQSLPIPPAHDRFFMIQVMESWFLADKTQLAAYFGPGFNTSALPGNPKIESIPKAAVEEGLKQATRQCRKGKYTLDKAGHGRELLSLIDPRLVRKASPECDRLFQSLGL